MPDTRGQGSVRRKHIKARGLGVESNYAVYTELSVEQKSTFSQIKLCVT